MRSAEAGRLADGRMENGGVDRAGRAEVERAEPISIEWLGEIGYGDALALQQAAVTDRVAGRTADRLFLLEHPAVVTLGRSTDPSNLNEDPEALRARGVEVFEVGRGGDVTYHAPGQLVGYPILDLDAAGRRDVHLHLRLIEEALIEALETVGVPATRVEGWTGVFVDRSRSQIAEGPERKIASIGVGMRRWVTFHGFALNVSLDLKGFDAIVPCGLSQVRMTSVAEELGGFGEGAGEGAGAGGGEDAGMLAKRSELDLRVREAVGARMQAVLGASPSR